MPTVDFRYLEKISTSALVKSGVGRRGGPGYRANTKAVESGREKKRKRPCFQETRARSDGWGRKSEMGARNPDLVERGPAPGHRVAGILSGDHCAPTFPAQGLRTPVPSPWNALPAAQPLIAFRSLQNYSLSEGHALTICLTQNPPPLSLSSPFP